MELNTIQPMDMYVPASKNANKVGKDFESMFTYQVLELMQPKIDEDSPFTGGHGEEMFRHILNEHIADAITERGGLGIANKVEDQIAKYRELK